jgi:hypothetical protein
MKKTILTAVLMLFAMSSVAVAEDENTLNIYGPPRGRPLSMSRRVSRAKRPTPLITLHHFPFIEEASLADFLRAITASPLPDSIEQLPTAAPGARGNQDRSLPENAVVVQ